MLSCCCVPECGEPSQCAKCVTPEDDYALLVCHSMDNIIDDLWEILIDEKSIGFSTDTPFIPRGYNNCKGKCFITDISIWDKILVWDKFSDCLSQLPVCCLNNLQTFKIVDRDIFRKSVLTLALKLIQLNHRSNYGRIFLFRVIKESGVACYVDGEWIQVLGSSLTGKLIKQNICPPALCRPCSSVEDNYLMVIYCSSRNEYFSHNMGTFEIFVDGVSVFSTTVLGRHCYQTLLVNNLSVVPIYRQKSVATTDCSDYVKRLGPNGLPLPDWTVVENIKVVDKGFFLKNVLNISAKATTTSNETLDATIVVYRFEKENFCSIPRASVYFGTYGRYYGPPNLPPMDIYEESGTINMEMCPRTPTTPPVLQ